MKPLTSLILSLCVLPTLACSGEAAEAGASDASEHPQASAVQLPEGAQAVSFLGETLVAPERSAEVQARLQSQLDEAVANLEANPQGADELIWVGRRHAYLGDYRRAIEIFTEGIERFPDDARFLRHRGHRYISVRELDHSIADYRQAAEMIRFTEDEVEPDGAPNALGIPTSTLHFNIWYHYGLAHYLKGEFDQAADKYRQCMEASRHPDSKIATAHWWYMSFRRQGLDEQAAELMQGLDLDELEAGLIESASYLELLRLYASAGNPDAGDAQNPQDQEAAALGYGFGAWELYNGNPARARAIYENMVAARNQWASFGYIAAEADLARMGEG